MENSIELQRAHWLYVHANELEQEAEDQQNYKGATKYPEPLNPDSWTSRGLINHAMQEIVDTKRYIAAMDYKFSQYEALIDNLKNEMKRLEKENKQLLIDNNRLNNEVRKAFSYGR